MSKRFTETAKWKDPWFRRLKPHVKLLFLMMLDECDAAGFWEPDEELARFLLGASIDLQGALQDLEGRVRVTKSGKWEIVKFVQFQYGTLSTSNPCHRGVLKIIEQRALEGASEGLQSPIGIGIGKGIEKGIGKEGDARGGEYHPDSRTVLHWLNEKSGKRFREVDANLAKISARLREPGVTLEAVQKMIERQCVLWGESDMAQSLQPSTLFGVEKFDQYLAAADQPVVKKTNGKPKSSFEAREIQETIEIKNFA